MSHPLYDWVCFSCQQSNPAGLERCSHCGTSARQSGKQIAEAERGRHLPAEMRAHPISLSSSPHRETQEMGLLGGIAALAFCGVCIYGGLSAIDARAGD